MFSSLNKKEKSNRKPWEIYIYTHTHTNFQKRERGNPYIKHCISDHFSNELFPPCSANLVF